MTPFRSLGLIVPHVNDVMAPELLASVPGATCDVRRIPPRGRPGGILLVEDMPAYGAAALSLAASFAPPPSAIVYGCTAGGFLAGADAEAILLDEMRAVTGRSCVGTARAVADALVAAGVKAVAVVTPYDDGMNEALEAYLAEFGIGVVGFTPLKVRAGGHTTDAVRIATAIAASTPCDGILIACSLVPTVSVLEELRTRLGLPVISSIGATADAIMATFGLEAAGMASTA